MKGMMKERNIVNNLILNINQITYKRRGTISSVSSACEEKFLGNTSIYRSQQVVISDSPITPFETETASSGRFGNSNYLGNRKPDTGYTELKITNVKILNPETSPAVGMHN